MFNIRFRQWKSRDEVQVRLPHLHGLGLPGPHNRRRRRVLLHTAAAGTPPSAGRSSAHTGGDANTR